jgi:single-strand DNA-binding protein
MASVNRVIFIGNLTRDPALKYLPSQLAVAEFGLAMNHRYKTASGEAREEVCFVDCSAFGKTGEAINQYFQKGKPIYIEGRLKYDTWEDKNGGGKRSRHVVVVDNFQFVGSKDGGGDAGGQGEPSGGGYQQRSAPQQNRPAPPPPRPAPAPPAEQPFSDEQQFKDDDIPF